MLAMMFGQLSNRESLRDLIVALEAHRAKQYHLGLGREPIAKTTLATANQNRDYRIFEDFAFYMMKEACEKRATNILDIPGPGVEPAAAEPLLREYYCSRNLICCVCQSIDSTMAMDSTLYPSARSVAPPFCWPFSIAMPIPMTSPPAW